MTLIKTDPVATIRIDADGKPKFEFPELDTPQPCSECGKMTTHTRMGFAECEDCLFYENCCEKCAYGIPQSTYHTDGFNDLADRVSHWTACGIRNCMMEIIPVFDPESHASSWHVSVKDRKKCFKPKNGSQ